MDKLIQPPLTLTIAPVRHGSLDYLATTAALGFSLATGELLEPHEALAAAVTALAPGAAAKALAPEAAKTLAAAAETGVTLDLGHAKVVGEFLAAAVAHAPDGTPAESVETTLAVGELTRTFLARGEPRDGQSGLGDDPGRLREPFASMPLDWTRAERQVRESAPASRDPSPALGDPAPNSPASPLPVPLTAESLASAGTWNEAWLRDAWPGFPSDFDYTLHNVAQPAQRLAEGYFRGDEPILAINAHPAIPRLESRLPGLRLRLIFVTRRAAQLTVAEAGAVLDTVWLLPDREVGLVVWHANFPVAAEYWAGVDQVMAALEPISEPPADLEAIVARALAGFEAARRASDAVSTAEHSAPAESEAASGPASSESASDPASSEAGAAPDGAPSESEVAPDGTPSDSEAAHDGATSDSEAAPKPAPSESEAAPEAASPKFEAASKSAPKGASDTPAPAPAPAPEPPAGPGPPAAASLIAVLTTDASRLAERILPEVNSILDRAGRPILTMEVLAPLIAGETARTASALEGGARALSQGAPALSQVSPADRQAALTASLGDSGIPAARIDKILSALATTPPSPSSYPNLSAFGRAADDYALRWASLMGASREAAQSLASDLKSLAMLRSPLAAREDQLAAGARLILGEGSSPQDRAAMAAILAGSTPDEDSLTQSLSAAGLSPSRAANLAASVRKLITAARGPGGPAGALARLKALAPELDEALQLEPGSFTERLERALASLRRASFNDPLVRGALRELGSLHPELGAALPEMERLLDLPVPPHPTLALTAAAAGALSHQALAAITALDPLDSPLPTPPPAPRTRPAFSRAKDATSGKDAPGAKDSQNAPDGIQLLERKDVEAWLKAHPLPAGLSGESLAGLDLHGLDLSGRDLKGIDLRGANLTGANLAGAKLKGAALDGADLSGARLELADLASASLIGAVFRGSVLTGINLSEAVLDRAEFSHTTVKSLRAPGASLIETILPRNLSQSILSGATIQGVNLARANLSGADLSGATIIDCPSPNSNLSGANIMGANIMGCDLTDANLSGAGAAGVCLDLGTSLVRADLSSANLTGASLRGIKAPGARFDGAAAAGLNLAGADLKGAKLAGAALRGAVLHGANLAGADLRRADLLKASLGGADLDGANLEGASLHSADLYRARLTASTSLAGADLGGTVLEGRERPTV